MSKKPGPKPAVPAPPPAPAPTMRAPAAWRPHVIPLAALWAAILAAYSNSFSAALVFDNAAILLKDPRLTAATVRNFHLIWSTEYWYPNVGNGLFRPLTTLSYLLNYSIFGNGPQPAGYHWMNFLLHAIAATLLYLLGLRIFRGVAPALCLSALWGLHPVLTESVTNVVGRADILAAIGVLAALLCHIRASNETGSRKWAWVAGVGLATAAGVFSKESAATVVVAALLYDLAFQQAIPWRDRLSSYAAMATAGLAYLAIRPAMLTPHFPFTDNPIGGADFLSAKLTAIKVIGKYLGLLVWPAKLSCDYSYRAIPLFTGDLSQWENLAALLALAVCLGALGLAFYGWRRNRPLFFFIGLFFIALAPTSNLVVTFGTDMAERLLYLPAMGFAGCLVVALFAAAARFAPERPVAAPAVVAVLCLALGVRTWARNRDWQSERTLWSSAVDAAPESYKAHQTYAGTGLPLDDTIREVGRALEIVGALPDALSSPLPFINAGRWYRQKGDSLIRQDPAQGAAWYGKSQQVLEHADRILRLARQVYPELYEELGMTYLRTGDFRGAVEQLTQAVRWRPQTANFETLSSAYYQAGDARQAEIALMQGLVVNPNNSKFVIELIDLYHHTDPNSCAVETAGGSSSLNPGCPLVHEQLCAAAGRLVEIYSAGNRTDLADQTRASMAGVYGCGR